MKIKHTLIGIVAACAISIVNAHENLTSRDLALGICFKCCLDIGLILSGEDGAPVATKEMCWNTCKSFVDDVMAKTNKDFGECRDKCYNERITCFSEGKPTETCESEYDTCAANCTAQH